jgi:UrcA family protein
MLRILTVSALLTLGIVGAHAADDDVTTLVSYADLDLSQPAGAKTLAARLQDAATAVCLKANPEKVTPGALENCVNMSVHMAMSRIEATMDEVVRDKLTNVRVAMKDL